jgi:hypothetical protein
MEPPASRRAGRCLCSARHLNQSIERETAMNYVHPMSRRYDVLLDLIREAATAGVPFDQRVAARRLNDCTSGVATMLGQLRIRGVINFDRAKDGKFVFYRITEPEELVTPWAPEAIAVEARQTAAVRTLAATFDPAVARMDALDAERERRAKAALAAERAPRKVIEREPPLDRETLLALSGGVL